jgi:hypothetical protein
MTAVQILLALVVVAVIVWFTRVDDDADRP